MLGCALHGAAAGKDAVEVDWRKLPPIGKTYAGIILSVDRDVKADVAGCVIEGVGV